MPHYRRRSMWNQHRDLERNGRCGCLRNPLRSETGGESVEMTCLILHWWKGLDKGPELTHVCILLDTPHNFFFLWYLVADLLMSYADEEDCKRLTNIFK